MGASDVLAKKKEERNFTGAKSRTLAQGLTLGFGDEIEAAVRNPGLLIGLDSSKEEYERDLKNSREAIANYRQDYPGRSALLEMSGAVAPFVGSLLATGITGGGSTAVTAPTLGRMSQLATRLPGLLRGPVAKGTAIGTAEGMAYGVGTQEGNILDRNFLNRDALVGGGFGFALPAALKGGGAVMNSRRNPVTKAEKSFENLLTSSGEDVDTALNNMVQSRNFDKPQMVADFDDQLTGRLAALQGMTGPQGGEIAERLVNRTAQQSERVVDDLTDTTNVPLQDTDRKARQVVAKRRAEAQPLYDAAYNSKAGQNITDPIIVAQLKSDEMKNAYNEGKTIYDAQNRARALRGEEVLPELPNFPEFQDGAEVIFGLRELDNIYRGMRTQADTAFNSGNPALGNAIKEETEAFVNKLDELVPEYKQARRSFRSNSDAFQSLQDGRNFWKKGNVNARTLKEDLKGLDPASQDLFRMGAVDQLRLDMRQAVKVDNMGSVDMVNKFFSRGDQRDRARLLFEDGPKGDKAFAQFENNINQEARMMDTQRRTQGSRTTPLREQVEQQRAEETLFSFDPALGLTGNLKRKLFDNVKNRVTAGAQPQRQELANLLMDPVAVRGQNNAPTLSPRLRQFQNNLLQRNQQADQIRNLLNSRSAAMAAGTTGLLGTIGNRD